jgi:hypothetical protein
MKYHVHLDAVVGVSVTVEADTPEEAIDKAYEDGGFEGLCYQCSGYREPWSKEEGDYEPVSVTTYDDGKEVWGKDQ